jgi:hypothetical protein
MPYSLLKSNSDPVPFTVDDGALNHNSALYLAGANFVGYGQYLNQNFIYLLENFANSTPPSQSAGQTTFVGQLWFDTTTQLLKVNTSTGYKALPAIYINDNSPAANTLRVGDLWFETDNKQFKIWSGTEWLLVGPLYSTSMGRTGAIPEQIVDLNSPTLSYTVTKFYVGGAVVAIMSNQSSAFVPQTNIPGFTVIQPGLNLSSLNGVKFVGTATNADTVGNYPPASFYFVNQDVVTLGNVQGKTSVNAGVSSNISMSVSGTNGNLTARTGHVLNLGVGAIRAATIDETGNVLLSRDPATNLEAATKQYVDTNLLAVESRLLGAGNISTLTGWITANIATANSNVSAVSANAASALNQAIYAANNFTATLAPKANAWISFANISNSSFGSNVTAITQAADNNTTRVATTAYADLAVGVLRAQTIANVNAVSSALGTANTTMYGLALSVGPGLSLSNKSKLVDGLTITILNTSNGYGTRTISSAAPTGGNDGDIWYQVL